MKQYGQAPTEARKDHPELDPLTDRNVPWYAWMLWPIVGIVALGLGMLLMRGCLGTVTP